MVTTHTPTRLITGVALMVMLLGLFVTAGPAPTAEAACDYPYAAFTINPGWGKEWTPNLNTCDSDQIYKGKVADTREDGSCVWVQFKEGTTIYTQATSCNSSGINYTFWDQNGDGQSNIRICRSAGCYPNQFYYTDFY